MIIGLHFNKESEIRILDESVQYFLKKRFMLPSVYINQLRCMESTRLVKDRWERWIRVFNPFLAKSHGYTIRTSADLDEHPSSVLFEGYMRSNGEVYMADRRQPKHIQG